MDYTTWHDQRPTHKPLSAAVIAAQEAFDAANYAFGEAMEDYYDGRCDILATHPYEQALTAAENALKAARQAELSACPISGTDCDNCTRYNGQNAKTILRRDKND